MKIEIFNVKAGQCAMVHCPNGKKVMIDAGHHADIPWRPSVHFKGVAIDNLIITNYDEDHVSDFVNLRENCPIRQITGNDSVNAAALLSLKGGVGEMGPGIKAIYDWLSRPPAAGAASELGYVTAKHYRNLYGIFYDTNNLSVATFFHYGEFTILFPGDLATAGWKELLKYRNFQDDLRKVNILVASHHGREDGYCEEVFNYCKPTLIIISDDKIQHATQEKTTGWYEKKALGVTFPGGVNRSVLTTRKDGHITIDAESSGRWTVQKEK